MSDEHSKDKRQMAAWVERQLAEKVDQVASKRGITRTAAIVEALQRYVEEETSTARQLQSLDEKLSSLLSNAPAAPSATNGALNDDNANEASPASSKPPLASEQSLTEIFTKLDAIIEQNDDIKADLTSLKTGKVKRSAPKKKPVEQSTMSLF